MIVGIFTGGKSRRMGGAPKGLLAAPDGSGSIVERLARVARVALPDAEIVLVGEATAYGALGLRAVADAVAGVGPIGGLAALLGATEDAAIALACDLPYVEAPLVARLATHAPEMDAVVPRVDHVWQPLRARYAPAPARRAVAAALAAGDRSLQRVIARLAPRVAELPLGTDEIEELRDWDSPADRDTAPDRQST